MCNDSIVCRGVLIALVMETPVIFLTIYFNNYYELELFGWVLQPDYRNIKLLGDFNNKKDSYTCLSFWTSWMSLSRWPGLITIIIPMPKLQMWDQNYDRQTNGELSHQTYIYPNWSRGTSPNLNNNLISFFYNEITIIHLNPKIFSRISYSHKILTRETNENLSLSSDYIYTGLSTIKSINQGKTIITFR